MRFIRVVAWTLLGVALAAGAQWTATGAAGLAMHLPAWAPPLLAPLGFVVFGAFLVTAYGGAPGAAQGILGALAALLLAGLPLAYTYGLAQRYGLPGDAGTVGALLGGPFARAAAALWLPVAVVGACRRARLLPARVGLVPAPAPTLAGAPAVGETAETPFWSPAPPLEPTGGSSPVAYTPGGTERA